MSLTRNWRKKYKDGLRWTESFGKARYGEEKERFWVWKVDYGQGARFLYWLMRLPQPSKKGFNTGHKEGINNSEDVELSLNKPRGKEPGEATPTVTSGFGGRGRMSSSDPSTHLESGSIQGSNSADVERDVTPSQSDSLNILAQSEVRTGIEEELRESARIERRRNTICQTQYWTKSHAYLANMGLMYFDPFFLYVCVSLEVVTGSRS